MKISVCGVALCEGILGTLLPFAFLFCEVVCGRFVFVGFMLVWVGDD